MKKTPKVRYVDMAIYVDKYINTPEENTAQTYEYLVMLAYMLASKRRFFNREDYYDDFAKYVATFVYLRMTDKRQDWHTKIDKKTGELIKDENGKVIMFPPEILPIKSCLNYMKHILYARKVDFMKEEFEQATNEEECEQSDACKEYSVEMFKGANGSLLDFELDCYFSTIQRTIWKYIYNGVYGNDKLLCWKLYVSTTLSLLRNFTLSNYNRLRLFDKEEILNEDGSVKSTSYVLKPNYHVLLDDLIADETRTAPIVYDLDKEYLDYVAVVLQKVKIQMIKDIRDINNDYSYSEEMLQDVFMSELEGEE